MRRSHPTAFVLKKRDSCAVCNNIAPCPACPKGQQCQQIFRSSCQDCPVNKCVPIPGYSASSGSSKSALGGGLAALFIVALGAIAFWFWRRLKAKRRIIALHEDAMERREKLRNEKEAMTLQLGANGPKSTSRTPTDPTSPFAIVDDDLLDNDTEYTQVTGVLNNNNNNDHDRLGSLAEPTAFRRRSFGAATHLSRITEGAEEEEEEQMHNGHRKRNTVGSIQSASRSFASGAGPRISIASGTSSFGSQNIIPIAFKPSPSPSAAAAADNGVDTAADDASLAGYQSISPVALPSTAHRATGAPAIQVNTARQGPVRPTRAPDLNLRLPEPHKPATSSPLAQSTAHNLPSSAASDQPAYQFMSIDPVEALKSSGPYSRSSDRPLSGATINTIGSAHSTSLSYVLSAPQVITPVSGEGVRRVQLGNGGKAQLVKVPSLKRKDSKKDKPKDDPFGDPHDDDELLPPPANRFGGAAKDGDARLSTNSTSTLGIPFGENPFGPSPFHPQPPNQASPSDAEDRSSWLGASTDSAFTSTAAARERDPFQDPTNASDAEPATRNEDELRTSIGGLSLLAQFPFDVSAAAAGLPEDALQRVEQFK
ncbi:conserved hypothetical protein [Sporisorium reilianum SRZ2]|uniref:Membrane anchor Opy2 N-terminal domain-containing protein n=1 Tax=Sporisorium reilianum (strain SRZ2) TaxID=999809 RepID=E6ZM20_SPORE|nr:conserved hypothetical protein [Sporisorium reilianum SRZ2]